MTTKAAKPIRIMKAGKFKPVKGDEIEFSDAILQEIAANYDATKHQAPLVIGHPKDADPAYGWVKGVSFSDGFLVADPDQVDPSFADMVEAGKFKFVSASLYAPTTPNNPTPGKWNLRHVGFLGAKAPAVKGLGAVSFGDDDADVVTLEFAEQYANGWDLRTIGRALRGIKNYFIAKEGQEEADRILPEWDIEQIAASGAEKTAAPAFSDPPAPTPEPEPQPAADFSEREAELATRNAELDAKAADIAAREQKLREQGFVDFADAQIQDTRLVPAQRELVLSIFQQLDGDGTVSFGEGDAAQDIAATDAFKKFIETLPKQVDLSERSPADPAPVIDLSDGKAIGAAAQQLMRDYEAKGQILSADQAVNMLTNGGN
jgi:hypothetical protein